MRDFIFLVFNFEVFNVLIIFFVNKVPQKIINEKGPKIKIYDVVIYVVIDVVRTCCWTCVEHIKCFYRHMLQYIYFL